MRSMQLQAPGGEWIGNRQLQSLQLCTDTEQRDMKNEDGGEIGIGCPRSEPHPPVTN